MTSAIPSQRARGWLLAILLVSAGLRLHLAGLGGQGYWPDENRYEVARQTVATALQGDWRTAGGLLLGSPDHVLFRFIGLVPALLEHAFFRADAIPPGFAAGFFGLFGVGAIALIWLIARQETDDEPMATWCAFFYAGCVTGFFLGRHYFPYEPALCLLLLGWWLGLRSHSPRGHWLTGLVVGLGYLTYNAYWNLGAVILIFHVLRPRPGSSPFARAGWAALGLATPLLAIILAARVLGYDLIAQAREFSHTVTQGGFGQGWRYIPSYFAAAEGAFGALLLLLTGGGLVRAVRKGAGGILWWWLAMGGVLAGIMIFFSDVMPRFALSGRSIKILSVFLALGAGLAAGRGGLQRMPGLAAGLVVLAVGLAALNFRVPLSLRFPREFRIEAAEVIAAERARDPAAALQLYYADFMHLAEFLPAYPPHTVLRQQQHPLQYRPYQFEGFDAPTRAAFQTHDFSMRLVRVTGAAAWQADTALVGADLRPYAGALQLEIDLPYPRPVGHTEPLVTAGIPGQADLFLVRYLDGESIEILVDHWNWGMVRSEPFRVPAAAGQPHQLVLCAGSLLPPAGHSALTRAPGLAALTRQVILTWNGRSVLQQSLPLYATPVSGVAVGGNYVGGTTTDISFTGRIRQVRQVDPRLLLHPEWNGAAPALTGRMDYRGLGPIGAELEWDAAAAQQLAQESTVFAAGNGTDHSRLTVRPRGTEAVFTLWERGERIVESAPLSLPARPHRLEIWSPRLAASAPAQPDADPTLREWMQGNFLLLLDGRPVIRQGQPAPPSHAPAIVGAADPSPVFFVLGQPWPLDAAVTEGVFPGRITSAAPVDLEGPVLLRALTGDMWRGPPLATAPPGPLRLTVRFPAGRTGAREPLFASGKPGVADVIFVVYEADGRIRLGHDHWGWELLLSEPIDLDPAPEHTIDISIGSLFPSDDSAWRPSPLTALSRTGRLQVAVDGRPVLSAERECYLAPLSSVVIGKNLAGASTCGPEFTGEVREVRPLGSATDLPVSSRQAGNP